MDDDSLVGHRLRIEVVEQGPVDAGSSMDAAFVANLRSRAAIVGPMRASDSSPAPSPRSSLRAWLNLSSPSLCKGVAVSPSLFSLASSPSSSRQSSFRLPGLSSSNRLSFRSTTNDSSSRTPKQSQSQSQPQPPAPTPPLPRRSASSSHRVAQLKHSIASSRLQHSPVAAKAAGTAAGGYALALAELSESLGILTKVNQDVDNLLRLLEHEELVQFLKNPAVADDKKKSLLRTLAEDGNFQEHTITFLNVLVDKRRVGQLKDILGEFERIYDDLNDTELATVTSAAAIDSAQLDLIARKIQGLTGVKNIRMKNVVDASLMAGYVVRFGKNGSRVLDMSVKGQLDRLASQFPSPRPSQQQQQQQPHHHHHHHRSRSLAHSLSGS